MCLLSIGNKFADDTVSPAPFAVVSKDRDQNGDVQGLADDVAAATVEGTMMVVAAWRGVAAARAALAFCCTEAAWKLPGSGRAWLLVRAAQGLGWQRLAGPGVRQDKRLDPVSAAIPGRMSMVKKKSNRRECCSCVTVGVTGAGWTSWESRTGDYD
ncbi:hypothetical protein E4U59_003750 [Claviceps monticola]|nr:hypothetical protein E4U59_003750 [Claviceps monticola]